MKLEGVEGHEEIVRNIVGSGIPVMGHCRNAQSIADSVTAGMDMLLHATFMDQPTLELVVEKGKDAGHVMARDRII